MKGLDWTNVQHFLSFTIIYMLYLTYYMKILFFYEKTLANEFNR